MFLKLIIITLFIGACSNSSRQSDRPGKLSSNPCKLFKIRSAGNDINLSHKRKFDFGPVYVSDIAYANLVFYTKSADYKATNIVGELKTSNFSFGGSFPGLNPSHGGCGYTLKSNKSCKINLQFTPNMDIPYAGIFILTYEVNGGICKQAIDLQGSGMKRL